jgi:hypothetical protein
MTENEVTVMLAEAIDQDKEYKSWHISTKHLMTFAAMVAAKERRNCVDTLAFHGEISKDDDSEWSEVVFWCCSRINNPIPTDKTLAPNYKQIDNARGQV